mmetsp:Transcript_12584/g.49033  ORF Transcript_12584/g.49033 Transcript_12584/m.49033 type:complete len:391 (-) Transcript_12584:669-1841(-)
MFTVKRFVWCGRGNPLHLKFAYLLIFALALCFAFEYLGTGAHQQLLYASHKVNLLGAIGQPITSGRKENTLCASKFEQTNLSEEHGRTVSLEGYYGRLGNKLTSMRKMIGFAELNSCHIALPPGILKGWNHESRYFVNSASFDRERIQECKSKSGKDWFYLKGSKSKCYLDVMRRYFNVNATHALGWKCNPTAFAALHVRSGDVARGGFSDSLGVYVPGKVHKGYALYPTSYYLSVINNIRSRKGPKYDFVVFCEDLRNPTCGFFQKFGTLDKRVKVRIGEPLIDDVRLMLCAEEVATSRGTFSTVFQLSTQLRMTHEYVVAAVRIPQCIHRLNATNSSSQLESGVTQHWMLSASESRYYENSTGVWKNTGLQRDVVNRHFEMTSCQLGE